MRIIAGDLKGRRLEAPLDDRVRPTTDKVREAIFDLIMPYVEDAVVADLFAGTGGLGIEAISRGAARVTFSDNSADSIRLIKKNVSHCGIEDVSRIVLSDFRRVLKNMTEQADIIFLDPPYKAGFMESCIEYIIGNDCLSEDGIIVAEHSAEEKLPDTVGPLEKLKERRYGKIEVTIYSFAEDEETEESEDE